MFKTLTTVVFFAAISPAFANDAPQIIGQNIFGLLTDFQNDPVMINERSVIETEASATRRLDLEKAGFEVASFDREVGAVYVTRLDQKSGARINTAPVNSALVNGVTHPVGGAATPWGTLLYSEANAVDGKDPAAFVDSFRPYFKNREEMVNPYHYGWTFEVILLGETGTSKMVKNYAAGRVAATDVLAMPDGKTVYMHDGKNSGNLYVFVAEEANSLSKGSLYAAEPKNGSLKYHLLGKTSGLKTKFKLKKVSFSKLFNKAEPGGSSCKQGFSFIDTVYGKECLQIKDKRYAGIFDPIRTAALKGVGSFSKNNLRLSFDETAKAVVLKQNGKVNSIYSLGSDSELNSDYVMQEVL